MDSLAWVDQTYITKHKGENPDDLRAMYYPNLKLYDGHKGSVKKSPYDAMMAFFMRFGRKAALSLAVYIASFIPVVGRFVLPAASFYTFNKAVGTPAAVVIFGSGIFVPKRYLVMFLQSYFSSRSLMRDLVCVVPSSTVSCANDTTATAIFLSHSVLKGAEEAVVPRSRRRAIWFRSRLLRLNQGSTCRSPHIRHRRSVDCISRYQDHGAATATI